MAARVMRTGVFTPPEPDMPNLECVRQVASAGIHAFEPFAAKDLDMPDLKAAAAVRDEAKRLGVELPCLSMVANLSLPDEVERLKKYVDVAAHMEIPLLHHTIYPSLQPEEKNGSFDALLELVLPRIREVYDYGADKGVQCVYEDQGFQFNGVYNFEKFLEKLNRPAGVVLDLGNIAFAGEHADDFARRFAERIVHVHVKDYAIREHAVAGAFSLPDGNHLEAVDLGKGDMHIQQSIQIMKSCGYSGWYMIECSPVSDPYAEQLRNMNTLNQMILEA